MVISLYIYSECWVNKIIGIVGNLSVFLKQKHLNQCQKTGYTVLILAKNTSDNGPSRKIFATSDFKSEVCSCILRLEREQWNH